MAPRAETWDSHSSGMIIWEGNSQPASLAVMGRAEGSLIASVIGQAESLLTVGSELGESSFTTSFTATGQTDGSKIISLAWTGLTDIGHSEMSKSRSLLKTGQPDSSSLESLVATE